MYIATKIKSSKFNYSFCIFYDHNLARNKYFKNSITLCNNLTTALLFSAFIVFYSLNYKVIELVIGLGKQKISPIF